MQCILPSIYIAPLLLIILGHVLYVLFIYLCHLQLICVIYLGNKAFIPEYDFISESAYFGKQKK